MFHAASKHPAALLAYDRKVAHICESAAILAEPARASMVTALLDGRALPAGELATRAGISAQTASNHLGRLLAAAFVEVEIEGRHRYYRLAGQAVADAVEALACLAPTSAHRNLRGPDADVRFLRHCYSHLAGIVAVKITEHLERERLILPGDPKSYRITATGAEFFRSLSICREELQPRNGVLAKRCLDWTERRHHLGGPLGVAFYRRLLQLGWMVPFGDSRALRVTHLGAAKLEQMFGIALNRQCNAVASQARQRYVAL